MREVTAQARELAAVAFGKLAFPSRRSRWCGVTYAPLALRPAIDAAAPTIRATGTASFGTAGTITPTNPTHATDDILLMFVGSSANASVSPTHSTPTNWTAGPSAVIASGTLRARCSLFWKRATSSSETNPSSTVTPTGSTACHHSAVVISVQDALRTGTPIEGANTNSAAATNVLLTTLTTSTNDTLAFNGTHHADNVATGVTNDNSYTQRVATDNATGIDGFLWVGSKTVATAGSGQGTTVTFTSGGTGVGIAGVAFAVKPIASTAYQESLSETVSLSESIFASKGNHISLSENWGSVGESLASAYAAKAGPQENVSLSESLSTKMTALQALSENLGAVGEAVAVVRHAFGALNDAVTLSDELASKQVAVQALPEALALDEALAVVKRSVAALSDSVDLAEAIVAFVAHRADLNEGVGLIEESASISGSTVDLAETVSLSEALTAVKRSAVALSDSVTAGEALTVALRAIVGLNEGLSLDEEISPTLRTIAILSETVGLAAQIESAAIMTAQLEETVGLAETLAAVRHSVIALNEAVSLSDSISAATGIQHYAVQLAELVPWTETIRALRYRPLPAELELRATGRLDLKAKNEAPEAAIISQPLTLKVPK